MFFPQEQYSNFDSSPSHDEQECFASSLTQEEKRYQAFLNEKIFHAVVTDLDGVVVQYGVPHSRAFQSLLEATLLHPEGKLPLVLATGRSRSMIEDRVLPYIERALAERSIEMKEGDLTVFSSNGAYAYDVTSGKIYHDDRLQKSQLTSLVQLETVKTLLMLRVLQQRLFGMDHHMFEEVPQYRLDSSGHTLLIGTLLTGYEEISGHSVRGMELIERFNSLFGEQAEISTLVEVINDELRSHNIPIEAWTSNNARFIGFQVSGVSKQRALDFLLQHHLLEYSSILSLGDSPGSNDAPLIYRDSGICNRLSSEIQDTRVLCIQEEGDQWERVAALLKNATMTPFDSSESPESIESAD